MMLHPSRNLNSGVQQSMKRLLILALLLSATAHAGVVYSATTKSKTGEATATTWVRGYIQGPNARLEFLQESSIAPGTYIVSRDGGKTFVQIDPEQKTFTRWQGPQSNVATAEEAKAAKTSVTEPKIEKLLDEDGGLILGMPTRHVRYRTTYSFTITLLKSHTTHMVSEDDIWITQQIKDPALKQWLTAETGEEADALTRSELSKINGVPLKRLTTLTSIEEDGEAEDTRTEMNVTEIAERELPDSTFAIPDGFKEKDAPAQPTGADLHEH
jgi:hypothetical protein